MRLVSFNVLHGRSPDDGRVDLDRFAASVASLDADVLALQEVDRDQPRSHHADLTAVAAEAMGARHRCFAPALFGTPGGRWRAASAAEPRADGPAYGCAVLSRHPVTHWQVFRMPAAPVAVPLWVPKAGPVIAREEPRVAVAARVEPEDGRPFTVVGTHLPFVPGWNRLQLRRLARSTTALPGPLLLLGDLNLRGRTPAAVTGWRALAEHATFPAGRPRFQLDHALWRTDGDDGDDGDGGDLVVTGSAAPQLPMSDHRALVVDVAFAAAD